MNFLQEEIFFYHVKLNRVLAKLLYILYVNFISMLLISTFTTTLLWFLCLWPMMIQMQMLESGVVMPFALCLHLISLAHLL